MKSKNSIIEILQAAGYKNTGTNRERTIRNLNLLIDAGVISFEFINADLYADLTPGNALNAFRYKSNDGKVRTTAYKVTIFGKRFFGQYIPKKRWYNMGMGFGTCEEIINNYFLDIYDIMTRVARLISILKGNGDFLGPQMFAANGDCSCSKCNGNGIIPQFAHYANGVCFDCGGTGIVRNLLKAYIAEAVKASETK